MPKLFGVDIKVILDKNVAKGLFDAVLTRYVPGVRGSDLTAEIPKVPEDHPCKGFWQDYSPRSIDGTNVILGDRKAVLMLCDVTPQGEDTIFIKDNRPQTLVVVRLQSSDPVGATYTVQCRDRATTPV